MPRARARINKVESVTILVLVHQCESPNIQRWVKFLEILGHIDRHGNWTTWRRSLYRWRREFVRTDSIIVVNISIATVNKTVLLQRLHKSVPTTKLLIIAWIADTTAVFDGLEQIYDRNRNECNRTKVGTKRIVLEVEMKRKRDLKWNCYLLNGP